MSEILFKSETHRMLREVRQSRGSNEILDDLATSRGTYDTVRDKRIKRKIASGRYNPAAEKESNR